MKEDLVNDMKKEEKQKVKFEDFSLKGPTGTAADKNKKE
jgi:hypothetical protein